MIYIISEKKLGEFLDKIESLKKEVAFIKLDYINQIEQIHQQFLELKRDTHQITKEISDLQKFYSDKHEGFDKRLIELKFNQEKPHKYKTHQKLNEEYEIYEYAYTNQWHNKENSGYMHGYRLESNITGITQKYFTEREIEQIIKQSKKNN